ncbi:MAG: tetratricopeptide repeat protein [Sphingobacteriaceae bacterium]|nr:tetratricopeptide repeat protein [Sphingobacteriaceae bacterium]
MRIIQPVDDFLYSLFPTVRQGDLAGLEDALRAFYSVGDQVPEVTIKDGLVTIDIHVSATKKEDVNFKKVVQWCEKGEFDKAEPLLQKLLADNPTNSEYHRIMGQILEEKGEYDQAINCLIDALRWDAKNGWALLLMGNIFGKHYDDYTTALSYYEQAIKANPTDHITINNIGGYLMQAGKVNEARQYFERVLRLEPNYPNTHYALALLAEKEGKAAEAFESAIKAIQGSGKQKELQKSAIQLAFTSAEIAVKKDVGQVICSTYQLQLEEKGTKAVRVIAAEDIPTAAKFEFAENYQRDEHQLRYKTSRPAVEHLIMHELVHLHLVIDARKAGTNQLFTSGAEHRHLFVQSIQPQLKQLRKMEVPEESIQTYTQALFEGLNRQVFNAPLDLFIEDYLYKTYPALRPYQFISWYAILREAIQAVTDKRIVELSPRDVLSKSKIYNLVGALQFKGFYGIDLLQAFEPTATELKQAQGFYDEYLEYTVEKAPGEEYELVQHWAEDLQLDKYFKLVDENTYRAGAKPLEQVLQQIENDPFDQNEATDEKAAEMEKFRKSQEAGGTNMAVVMYMVEALQYFKNMAHPKIKEIAFEIAMQGVHGYHPDKSGYKISTFPAKSFSGLHILAYYYVSWALAVPEMLQQLQLPYDAEYALAQRMYQQE